MQGAAHVRRLSPAVRVVQGDLMGVAFHPLTVTEIEQDTSSSVLVSLECPDTELGFEHGKYLTFRHEIDGVEIRRSYSICSPVDGALRSGSRVDSGAFSTWATSALRVGDTVEAMAPMGRRPRARSAGGPPTRCRRWRNHPDLLDRGDDPRYRTGLHRPAAPGRPGNVGHHAQLDDIEDLRNRHLDRFRVWRQLTREPQAPGLLDGRPSVESFLAGVERGLFPAAPDHVFLCGPELIETITDAHTRLGLQPEQIHTELFTSAQSGHPPGSRPDRRFDRTGRYRPSHARRPHQHLLRAARGTSPLRSSDPAQVPLPCRRRVFDLPGSSYRGEVEMATTYGLIAG